MTMFLKFLFNSLKQNILNVSLKNFVLKYNPDTSTRITLFFCNQFIQKNSLKCLKFLSTLNMRLKKYNISFFQELGSKNPHNSARIGCSFFLQKCIKNNI